MKRSRALFLFGTLFFFGCGGGDGAQGPAGAPGAQGPVGPVGPTGTMGDPGTDGQPGQDGRDGRDVIFAGQGLAFELVGATITGTTATVEFTIADASGTPLDRDGHYTQGAVSTSFVLAVIEEDEDGEGVAYRAYTTRTQTSPITNASAEQAATDSGGTYEELEPGRYRYTFGTAVAVADAGWTHTIGAYATRSFEDETSIVNDELSFRPDGAAVTTTREIVTDAACAQCHDALSAHGGSRRDVLLCQTCHTPQTIDPDTGNSVDWKVMIHKIHRGASLPTVVNGGTYEIIGFRQTSHDYSTVHFPQLIERCDVCHQGADSARAIEAPGRDSCLACHDTTSFVDPPPANMVLHGGGAQPEDAPCNVCHAPVGSIAGVTDVHLTPLLDPANPDVGLELISVANSGPGMTPTVRFRVTVDDMPRDIIASPLSALRLNFAGPNTDFSRSWQPNVAGAGLVAVDAANGVFEFTVGAGDAIPVDAEGSYTVGMEGNLRPATDRFAAYSPVMPFAVTDAAPVARRTIVSSEKCNSCHFDLALHGGQRKNPGEYCIMCHNTTLLNSGRSPRPEGEDIYVNSTDLKRMIHKIHAGEELSQPYALGGFGGPIDFGHLRYPSTLSNCSVCHEGDSYQLPMPAGAMPSVEEVRTCLEAPGADTNDACETAMWIVTSTIVMQPEKAACTSCHDSPSAAAHADIMTTPDGRESCATCHGPGAGYDVDVVHGN